MKNTLLFSYSANILVRLLTVNMKNYCLTPKNRKMCDLIIVNRVVKMNRIQQRHIPSASYKEVPPQSQYPIIVVYFVANYTDSILVTFEQICNFRYAT